EGEQESGSVRETQTQFNLPGVPKAKQGREVPQQWEWTEASVWTERMLATLTGGIKGGKWFSLMDKVYKIDNLQSALKEVTRKKGAGGVDGMTTERFLAESPQRLVRLQSLIKEGKYLPQPAKRVWIEKPGSKEKRPLGVPTVEDRFVQSALRHVIEPIFENTFAEHSYGFRPGRGAKGALRRVNQVLKAGNVWVVDADLKGYFDSIPQDKLMEHVIEHIADGAVLELIWKFLKQGVMESGRGWQPTETGTPQGAVISPLLANIYLNPLDHLMAKAGKEMVRYADDFVVMCKTEEEARETLEQIRSWVEQVGLVLHPTKTRIVDASQKGGFDFLGYHFERGKKWPRKKSLTKFKDSIREKTGRIRPGNIQEIVRDVNLTLRGWFEYFKHSAKGAFKDLDAWVRGRLRSILCSRHGKPSTDRWTFSTHKRWPLNYFEPFGLISMASLRNTASQSRRRNH
ncbi:MAG: ltrA 3, partial [Verrucomicrobiales bacterium]|nr:ltrA 3 [Verrucomicrobiales bacterium]